MNENTNSPEVGKTESPEEKSRLTKYVIDLIWNTCIKVEASTPREALEKAKELYPNHNADFIMDEDKGISLTVDSCNGCGAQILEGDEYSLDPEQGNSYCKNCTEAIKEDAKL